MADRSPMRSREQDSRAVITRYLFTFVVILLIVAGTVGVVALITRPPPESSGTPVMPSARSDPTPSARVPSVSPTTNPTWMEFAPGWDEPIPPSPSVSGPFELTDIAPDLGETSAALLHQNVGIFDGVRWEAIERSLPWCPTLKPEYPDPGTIVASRVRVGLAAEGVFDEEILIEFADRASAKHFLQALRAAITSCQYDVDPETWVVTDLEDYPKLGQEAFFVSSWSYEFAADEWVLAPGAGIGVWVREGNVVVGAGRSSGHRGDPREAPEIGFETVPLIAIEHVLAQLG